MSEKNSENHYNTQVIGGGPAGLGLAVAADRLGKLDDWLRSGVLFVDKGPAKHLGSGNLRGIDIRSNSPASDFLEAINKEGIFAEVINSEIGRIIQSHRDDILSLLLVAQFLEALGERFQRVLEDYPQSRLITNAAIVGANYERDGGRNRFETVTQDGRSFFSENLVLATGGRWKKFIPEPRLKGLPPPILLDSDLILRCQHTQDIIRSLEKSPHSLAIVGSSHGAWSSAHVLGENIFPARSFTRISILARKPVKVFYESREAANADGYHYDEGDICPKTGRVNRYGGIRGDARDLYRSVIESNGKHPITIVDASERNASEVREILDTAPVIISGVGPEANAVPIYENDECIGPQLRTNRQVYVDKNCRVFDTKNRPIDGAYALGLAHGVTPDESLGGESNFSGTIDGVNGYQGCIGERVLKQIL